MVFPEEALGTLLLTNWHILVEHIRYKGYSLPSLSFTPEVFRQLKALQVPLNLPSRHVKMIEKDNLETLRIAGMPTLGTCQSSQ